MKSIFLKIKKIFLPQKTRKGFSLMETLIAIFVFSLAMVMLAGAFSSFLKNYVATKKTQRNIENAEYAMNLIAKTLRTSAVMSTTLPLNIYDYGENKCLQYKVVSKKLQVSNKTAPIVGDPSSCDFSSMPAPNDLTPAMIDSASVTASSTSGSTIGKVTMALSIKDTASGVALPIQMTVSLRNNGLATGP